MVRQKKTFLHLFSASKISLVGVFIVGILITPYTFADTTYQCNTAEEKAACTALLTQTEQEIASLATELSSKKQEGSSLARDKAVLDLQIKQAQLKIKAHQLTIAQLGKDIVIKSNTINALTDRINQGKDSMSQILQRTREIDNLSLPEAFLSNHTLTDFFIDLDTFASIKRDLQSKLTEIQQNKQENETAKNQLATKQNQEKDITANILTEKQKVQAAQAEKQRLLTINKNAQQGYQTLIADKQVQASKIRNALFALRDTAAIKFGDAVTYAKEASAKTGVSAAFILAIIQQESNLGSNVGACYLTGTDGAGVRTSGAVVSNLMKPSRDVQPFLQITQALGRDPYKTRVSCPFSTGYGGAMGPAQFIPSTWVLSQSRIMQNTGKSTADPWNPEDAFMASALYLADLGASSDSPTSQKNAACRYYSGRSCSGSNTFYGSQVMARVATLQGNIDILQGS